MRSREDTEKRNRILEEFESWVPDNAKVQLHVCPALEARSQYTAVLPKLMVFNLQPKPTHGFSGQLQGEERASILGYDFGSSPYFLFPVP